MQPQRETMTDNLTDIIQVIHLGNRSGTLTVERGEGEKREEGLLTFWQGKLVEADVGGQKGQAAFQYLTTWRTCRFAFVPYRQGPPLAKAPNSRSSPLPEENTSTVEASARPSGLIASARLIRLPAGEAALQHLESTSLSRTHRRLLLLIDGKRTKYEIARLIRRDLNEVQEMLKDLEQAGLIRQ